MAARRLATTSIVAILVASLLSFTAAACTSGTGSSSPSTTTPPRLHVVATTTVLGDVVRSVVGDGADVTVLMGPDDDPRRYVPSAEGTQALADADLVVTTGLGFEAGLQPALDAAAAAGVPVLAAAELVSPEIGPNGQPDPHVWLDPDRLDAIATELARRLDALAAAPGDQGWDDGVARYHDDLAQADEVVQATLTGPTGRIRTDSDGLGYFAARYGLVLEAAAAGPDTLSVSVDALGPPGSGRATTSELLTDTARRLADWQLAHPCSPDSC